MSGKPFMPTAIDIRAGNLVGILRRRQGLSQKALAAQLGITFQQMQKYECGENRMSVSRFYNILKILDAPFDGVFKELGRGDIYDADTRRAVDALCMMSASDRAMVCALIDRLALR